MNFRHCLPLSSSLSTLLLSSDPQPSLADTWTHSISSWWCSEAVWEVMARRSLAQVTGSMPFFLGDPCLGSGFFISHLHSPWTLEFGSRSFILSPHLGVSHLCLAYLSLFLDLVSVLWHLSGLAWPFASLLCLAATQIQRKRSLKTTVVLTVNCDFGQAAEPRLDSVPLSFMWRIILDHISDCIAFRNFWNHGAFSLPLYLFIFFIWLCFKQITMDIQC